MGGAGVTGGGGAAGGAADGDRVVAPGGGASGLAALGDVAPGVEGVEAAGGGGAVAAVRDDEPALRSATGTRCASGSASLNGGGVVSLPAVPSGALGAGWRGVNLGTGRSAER
jgi:hypothetical protein